MKTWIALTLVLWASSAFAEIDRECYNSNMQLEIFSVSDTDGNLAVVLEIAEENGNTERLISEGIDGNDFSFFAVFERPTSVLYDGTLSDSLLLTVNGQQARLARNGMVHYLQCL